MNARLTLLIISFLSGAILHQVEASAPSLDTVKNVLASLRGKDVDDLSFEFVGVILPRGNSYLFFADDSGGAEIHGDFSGRTDLRRWDRVRLIGRATSRKNTTPSLFAEKIELISHNHPPLPAVASGSSIRDGSLLYKLTRVKGVIASFIPDDLDTKYRWITLRTATGPVMVTVSGKWIGSKSLDRLVDAEVEITGLVIPATGWRSHLGNWLTLSDDDRLNVITPPRADPFSAPLLTDASPLHRQRTEGRVIAVRRDRFYLREDSRRLIAVVPEAGMEMPRSGSRVTAVGFADFGLFNLRLTEALIRCDSTEDTPAETPEPIDGDRLFKSLGASPVVNPAYNGKLIQTTGTVINVADAPNFGPHLLIKCASQTLVADLSSVSDQKFRIPETGSTISITGLCLAEFENTMSSVRFPRFRQFTIIPRREADIRILSRPPWWTPFRLLILALSLGLLVILSFIWSILLKLKSERRGKELYEEKIDHALAEQKVEERTRLSVELHDSVSQTLTGVALQLDGGEIETAKTMLASCRGELRRCLWDLRSRTFEEKDMTEAVTRTISPHLNGVEATVRFNVPRERLSESLTHAILRIIRELIVNAIRHGQAKHIRIAGEMHENTVSFSVTDDGCGFDPETAPGPEQGHFGLLGIRERIEDFNGTLKIASAPDKGAKFTVTLLAADETNEQ